MVAGSWSIHLVSQAYGSTSLNHTWVIADGIDDQYLIGSLNQSMGGAITSCRRETSTMGSWSSTFGIELT
jgi:hypothetical protein